MNEKMKIAFGVFFLLTAAVVFAQKTGINAEALRSRVEKTFDEQAQQVQAQRSEDIQKYKEALAASLDPRVITSLKRDFDIPLDELARDVAYIRSKYPNWNPSRMIVFGDCFKFEQQNAMEEAVPVWNTDGRVILFPSANASDIKAGIVYRANGKKAIISANDGSKCYQKWNGSQGRGSSVFWTAEVSLK